ncbi:MAG TPA: Spy/CpxP family protein refolding chaperone [Bryobacteraceae bacterium]|nr:Spy/CpxP family protein refolding chaperone [Bryobacteraceae bacterium]
MAALAVAQGRGGGGGGMGGGGGSPEGDLGGSGHAHATPKESKAEQVADRLKLNSEQKVTFNSLIEETQKDAAPVIQQVQKSRNDLANAMLNGKTEAEIAPLKQALSDAQFQMMGVEVKTFQKIVALLKPNQVSRAPEAFELMADIFLQPARGRGGWGR